MAPPRAQAGPRNAGDLEDLRISAGETSEPDKSESGQGGGGGLLGERLKPTNPNYGGRCSRGAPEPDAAGEGSKSGARAGTAAWRRAYGSSGAALGG